MARRRKKSKTLYVYLGIGAFCLVFAGTLALAGWAVLGRGGGAAESYPPIDTNPFTASDFVAVGGVMECTAMDAALGIDVSEHQGDIDWQQVAEAGIEFAFIRIGYRGYGTGKVGTDVRAAENLTGAQAAGIPVGAYFFSQAVSAQEAREEARFCIRFLRDYDIQLPVVFDWEYVSADARSTDVSRKTLTEAAAVFCEELERAGYSAMLYFNPHVGKDYYQLEALQDYPWWLAAYTDEMNYPYAIELWQFSENGKVPGISEDTDLNLMFTDWLP